MELREATELRSLMEVRIRDYICKELKEFKEKTNLAITDINIETLNTLEMGQNPDEIIVTDVCVRAEV
jgi:hypothetical protein